MDEPARPGVLLAPEFSRTSTVGRAARWFGGESGSEQGVNDAADRLLATEAAPRLLEFADGILADYLGIAATLPRAPHNPERLVSEPIPGEFLSLGGGFSKPELLLRTEGEGPPAVILSWGHMRHGIIVYAAPPRGRQNGRHVRKVGSRIFVVALEHERRQPPTRTRAVLAAP